MDILQNILSQSAPAEPLQENRDEIAEYIRLWGSSSSLTILDPHCEAFSIEGVRGVIGYRFEAGCAVVFGDPICAPEDKARLAMAFHAHCQKQAIPVVYVTVSEKFASWALENACTISIEIGDELIIDPHDEVKKGSIGRVLRRKTSHALRAGLRVAEYYLGDEEMKKQIEGVGEAWLSARRGPQIFFAKMDIFNETMGRRWFYAQEGERVLGVIVLNQLDSRGGFVLHLLMITPDAPVGTSELLVTSVIEHLKKEGCSFLSFGVSQGSELGEIRGMGPVATRLARLGFKMAQRIFSLDGRRRFWEKFQPKKESSLVVFTTKRLGIREIIALMRAFNIFS